MPGLEFHQFLTSSENIHIRYAVYGNKKFSSKFILFVLGRGEWIEKYHDFYDDLFQKLKLSILIIDHAGQGGSGGVLSHIDSYKDYVDHITQLLSAKFANKSYYIIGHSMGGLISLYGSILQDLTPIKMVMSSPLLGLPQFPVPRLLARPIAQSLCSYGGSRISTFIKNEISYRFTANRLTTDKEKYLSMQDSPYQIPPPTMGWVLQTFIAIDSVFYDYNLKNIDFPIAILHGSDERVVSLPSIKKWVILARKIVEKNILLVNVNGAKHEIFSEAEEKYNYAFNTVINFLKY